MFYITTVLYSPVVLVKMLAFSKFAKEGIALAADCGVGEAKGSTGGLARSDSKSRETDDLGVELLEPARPPLTDPDDFDYKKIIY